jgi:hypothetical protein
MERHLWDAGVCQVGPGAGAAVSAVVDSAHVGAEKPDVRIFPTADAGDTATQMVCGQRFTPAIAFRPGTFQDIVVEDMCRPFRACQQVRG